MASENPLKDIYLKEDIPQNHFYFPERIQISPVSTYNITCNGTNFAVPYGKDCYVYPHENGTFGERITKKHAKIQAHGSNILDLSLSPFINYLATTSDEKVIKLWKIPSVNEFLYDIKEEESKFEYEAEIRSLLFHPTVSGVISTTHVDKTVKFWSIEKGKTEISVELPSLPLHYSYSPSGEHAVVAGSDRVFYHVDIRNDKIAKTSPIAHDFTRGFNCQFLPNNEVITCGFNSDGSREVKLWDLRTLKEEVSKLSYDKDYGSQIPLVDNDLKLLYLASTNGGAGNGNISIIDFSNAGKLVNLCKFSNPVPQYGICMLPKSSLNTLQHEVGRFLKVGKKAVFSLKAVIPNPSQNFQKEYYPVTRTLSKTAPNTPETFFELRGKKLELCPEANLSPQSRRKNGFILEHGAKQFTKERKLNREEFEGMDKGELLRKLMTIQQRMDIMGKALNEMPELRHGDSVIKAYFQKRIDNILGDVENRENFLEFQVEYLKKEIGSQSIANKQQIMNLKTKIKTLKKDKKIEQDKYQVLLKEKLRKIEPTKEKLSEFSLGGTKKDFYSKAELEKKTQVLLRNMQKIEDLNRKIRIFYEEKINLIKINSTKSSVDEISIEEVDEFLKKLNKEEKNDFLNEKCTLHEDLLEQIVAIEVKSEQYEQDVKQLSEKYTSMNKKLENELDSFQTTSKEKIEKLTKENKSKDSQILELTQKLAVLQVHHDQKVVLLKKANQDLSAETKKNKELTEEMIATKKKHSLKVDEMDEKLDKAEEKIDEHEETIEKHEVKLDELNLLKKTNEDLIKKQLEKYEGLKEKFRKLRDEYRKEQKEVNSMSIKLKEGESMSQSLKLQKNELSQKNKQMKQTLQEKMDLMKLDFEEQFVEQQKENMTLIARYKIKIEGLENKLKNAKFDDDKSGKSEKTKKKIVVVKKDDSDSDTDSDTNDVSKVEKKVEKKEKERGSYEERMQKAKDEEKKKREEEEKEKEKEKREKKKRDEAEKKRKENLVIKEKKEKEEKEKKAEKLRLEKEKKEKEKKKKLSSSSSAKKVTTPKTIEEYKQLIKKIEKNERTLNRFIKGTKRSAIKNLKVKGEGWKEREKKYLGDIKDSEDSIKILKSDKNRYKKEMKKLQSKKKKVDEEDEDEDASIMREIREIERKKRERTKRDRERQKKKELEKKKKNNQEKKKKLSQQQPSTDVKNKKQVNELKRIISTYEKREKKLNSRIGDNTKKLEKLNGKKRKNSRDKKKVEDLSGENDGLQEERKKLLSEKQNYEKKLKDLLNNKKEGEKKTKEVVVKKNNDITEKKKQVSKDNSVNKKTKKDDDDDFSKLTREEIQKKINEINGEMRDIKKLLSDNKLDIRRFETEQPKGWDIQKKELIKKSNILKSDFRSLDKKRKELKELRIKAGERVTPIKKNENDTKKGTNSSSGKSRKKEMEERRKNRRNRKKEKNNQLAKFLNKKKKNDDSDSDDDAEIERELKLIEKKKREREKKRLMDKKKKKKK